jgi:hypothetical protein
VIIPSSVTGMPNTSDHFEFAITAQPPVAHTGSMFASFVYVR